VLTVSATMIQHPINLRQGANQIAETVRLTTPLMRGYHHAIVVSGNCCEREASC
jgi:hypothetical protein